MGAMGHPAVSLSKSALLLSPCIAWAGPKAKWYNEDRIDTNDTTKRDDGTSVHRNLCSHITGVGTIRCLNPNVGILTTIGVKYIDEVLGPKSAKIQSELAIGINWINKDVIVLPDVKNREYPKRKNFQFGTLDLVVDLLGGGLLVGDWKTGGSDGADAQLLSGLCGIRKYLNHPGPYFISCISLNEEGCWPHEREVSADELDTHWDEMRFAWEDIGFRNDIIPGIHCTTLYCPALAYCQAHTDTIETQAMLAGPSVYEPDLVRPMTLQKKTLQYTDRPLTDEEAGYTMSLISAARRKMKYDEAAMKEYIESGGKVILNGYEWSKGDNGHRWRRIK